MTPFTEADIRAGTNSQSFERGSSYYRNGAVSDVVRRGNLLTAQVSGSNYAPYEIAVTLLDDGGIGERDLHLSVRLGRLLQAHRRRPADGAAWG